MSEQKRFSVRLNEGGKYLLMVKSAGGEIQVARFHDGYDGFARELSVLFDRQVDVEIEYGIMKSCLKDTIKYLQETGNRGLKDAIYRMGSAIELVESRKEGE